MFQSTRQSRIQAQKRQARIDNIKGWLGISFILVAYVVVSVV